MAAAASAGGSLSTAAASLVPTPTATPAPRLLRRRSTKPAARASLTHRPKKPPPLSCAAAATPALAPAPAAASKSAGSWRDLCSLNAWVVQDYRRLVDSVAALEPALRRLSDEQLKAKTAEFRGRLTRGETLADVQAEAFAVVREAARRTLGRRHFDVQIIGGAVLNGGCTAEMKTGKVKTLVSTLAAYLNALIGEGVHATGEISSFEFVL